MARVAKREALSVRLAIRQLQVHDDASERGTATEVFCEGQRHHDWRAAYVLAPD